MNERERESGRSFVRGRRLTAYSALVPSMPLKQAAERFTSETGVEVDVKPGRPEQWMKRVAAGAPADVMCCGAEFLLDIAEAQELVVPGSRRSVGRRLAALVAPAGNPAAISSLADITRPGIRVGIAVEGCTLGLWDEIGGRASLTEEIRARIVARAQGCGQLLGLINHRQVDVAFGWANFHRIPGSRLEVVPLPEDLEVWRSTGVGVVSSSSDPELAGRFVAWLASPAAQEIYRGWGWDVQ